LEASGLDRKGGGCDGWKELGISGEGGIYYTSALHGIGISWMQADVRALLEKEEKVISTITSCSS